MNNDDTLAGSATAEFILPAAYSYGGFVQLRPVQPQTAVQDEPAEAEGEDCISVSLPASPRS